MRFLFGSLFVLYIQSLFLLYTLNGLCDPYFIITSFSYNLYIFGQALKLKPNKTET